MGLKIWYYQVIEFLVTPLIAVSQKRVWNPSRKDYEAFSRYIFKKLQPEKNFLDFCSKFGRPEKNCCKEINFQLILKKKKNSICIFFNFKKINFYNFTFEKCIVS